MIFITLFQLILSEIMINPEGSEQANEYIEIYNSGSASISLENLFISDGFSKDLIIVHRGSSVLNSGEYALILDPNYFSSDRIYGPRVDSLKNVYTLDNSTFGHNGFSNSKSEKVSLLNGLDTLDKVFTMNTSENGISMERRIHFSNQWMFSLKKGASPGFKNTNDRYIEFIHVTDFQWNAGSIKFSYSNQNSYRHFSNYKIELFQMKAFQNNKLYEFEHNFDLQANATDNQIVIFDFNPDIFQRLKIQIKNRLDEIIFSKEYNYWPALNFYPILITYIKTTKDQNFQIKNNCPYEIYIDSLKFKSSKIWKTIPVHRFLQKNDLLRFSKHDPHVDGIYNADLAYFYSKNMRLQISYNQKLDSIQYQIEDNSFNSDYESLIPITLKAYNHQLDWRINPSNKQEYIELDQFSVKLAKQATDIKKSKVEFQINYSEYDILKMAIYDLKGNRVKVISDASYFAAGKWFWDGRDSYNNYVETGVYLFVVEKRKVKTGRQSVYKKAFLIYK